MINDFLTLVGLGVMYIAIIFAFSMFLTFLTNKYFNNKDKK